MKIRKPIAIAAAWTALLATAFAAGMAGLQGNTRQTAGTDTPSTLLADGSPSAAVAATGKKPSRKPLTLKTTIGGELRQPLANGNLVYGPIGRKLSIWNYANPAAPVLAGYTDLAPGVIQGLARHGKYLYASWREGSCRSGGVVVYSLANPQRPRRVGEVSGYAGDVQQSCTAGIAIANNRLYLFDTENDLYVGSLADPRRPQFRPAGIGPGSGTEVTASGNLLYVGGKSMLFGYNLRTIDISVPDAPREAAFYSSPGTSIVNVGFQAPYAYGFGHDFSVLDMSDPAQIQMVGRTEMPYGAMTGMRLGQHVYTGGLHGMDVWSVADPAQPLFVANHELRTFGATHALPLRGNLGLMVGNDDRLLAIDGSNPDKPTFASERVQPGGVSPMDVAFVDGYAVLLQYNYGITVANPTTLAPLARLEPPLSDDPQARGYTAMTVSGKTAYLAVWGYGLIVVDLSTPLKPREIGRLEYPYASSVEVVGNRLYVGKNTDGPTMGIVDITDPSNPVLVSNWIMPDVPWAMATQGDILFSAEPGNHVIINGGVRVIDASDPHNLVELARWDADCGSATGLSLDAARSLLYVACRRGLRILDVSNAKAPRLVAAMPADHESITFSTVAVRGNRAWYVASTGIEEFDVSVPSAPRLLKRTAIAGYEPVHARNAPDGSLYATTYSAGVQILTAR